MAMQTQKRTKAPPKVIYDGIDITVPKFLAAGPLPPLSERVVPATVNGKRDWVMPDPNKPRVKQTAPIFVTNPKAPVEVKAYNGKTLELLASYEDLADFEAKHDLKTYPIKQTVDSEHLTIMVASPKPWAARKASNNDSAPPVSKGGKDLFRKITGAFVPIAELPASKLVPVKPKGKAGDSWGDSIMAACRGGATRTQVIDFLVSELKGERQGYENVMYGTLERLVGAGRLAKSKEGKNMVYRTVG